MQHLKYLRVWNIIYGLLYLLATLGLFAGAAAMFFTAADSDPSAAGVGAAAMIGGGLGTLLLTVLHFAIARSVGDARGRILQTILAVLNIGNVPVGTIYGIYALWVCWANEETKHLFV